MIHHGMLFMINIEREEGRELGETSFANLYNIFMTNVKTNLHIVLAMSPVGSSFRNRLRMFPSLINCCAIDWFTEWPEDALEKVASRFLEEMDMEEDFRGQLVVQFLKVTDKVTLLLMHGQVVVC